MKIIFSQGNPGQQYNNSRHNVGFMVLDALAASLGAEWTEKPRFTALAAEVTIEGEKTILIKPTTFYNETGVAARRIIDFYKIDKLNDFLVVHDDIDLPFGMIRIRKQGSDAGNNGIKSLNAHLEPDYGRIRIGTTNDSRSKMGERNFVLGKFSPDEQAKLQSDIIPQAIDDIKQFCQGGLTITSHRV